MYVCVPCEQKKHMPSATSNFERIDRESEKMPSSSQQVCDRADSYLLHKWKEHVSIQQETRHIRGLLVYFRTQKKAILSQKPSTPSMQGLIRVSLDPAHRHTEQHLAADEKQSHACDFPKFCKDQQKRKHHDLNFDFFE